MTLDNVRVLATGMTWPTVQPGGLNRYFSDYSNAWGREYGNIRSLVATNSRVALPHTVRGVELSGNSPFSVWGKWKSAIRDELSRGPVPNVINPHFAYFAHPLADLSVDQPIVTHFHGPWAYEAKVERRQTGIFTKAIPASRFMVMKAIEQRMYRHSDKFIVLSKYFRDILERDYSIPSDRIHVVPGAVNIEKFCDTDDRERVRASLGIPQNRIVLLSVRRLARRMGLENLIIAVDRLRSDFPDILLLIVGGGELRDFIQEGIYSRGLEPWVKLIGKVHDEILPDYYRAADLTIVPSLTLEGFGLVTVESLACGTPVAGTPVGGTKEILAGFSKNMLFDGISAGEVAKSLGEILSDTTKWPRRSKARQYVLDNYTWDLVLKQIERVFRKAIACTYGDCM